jgi:hypothetical protein
MIPLLIVGTVVVGAMIVFLAACCIAFPLVSVPFLAFVTWGSVYGFKHRNDPVKGKR